MEKNPPDLSMLSKKVKKSRSRSNNNKLNSRTLLVIKIAK